MNRRTEIDGEGDDAIPTAAPTCPGVRRRDCVIPFPSRRYGVPPRCPAAGDTPPVSLAPFIPVGQAVAAVILSLRGGFPRISVTGPGREEDNQGRS